ncbi:MAG: hypothetical protein L6R45_24540 [Anaerolineae bacterium]|nr:hypothetical protein [Anaerolineae bacterium]
MDPFLFPAEESSGTSNQPVSSTRTNSEQKVVVLQPIAMKIPNRHGIYSLNKLKPKKEINYGEFLTEYSDRPRKIRVCFNEVLSPSTILQQSEFVTAYGYGLDCWYIIEPPENNGNGQIFSD